LDRQAVLERLLDYLERRGLALKLPRPDAVATLEAAVSPRRSGTFRKGQPGNWREHFTEANKALFKEKTGDLLIRLGYEVSREW
jgi:hypothetical protein